ncbi:MAG: transglutaminase domain-containing protein, partial [Planctomycetales bacterium]|nr:transglutaminase domain-containing protein [Planctomycetales bacterium]
NASAIVTFEVTRRAVAGPESTDDLQIGKKLPRHVRRYLGPSPYIESRNAKIIKLAKSLVNKELTGWQQAEANYDYVREHVEYKNGKLKGALAALEDGNGDCEELTSLFIAICRVQGIPARTVWVPDHCYPEFYLVNAENEGQWYPCQAAGAREFGSMTDLRPILQKGDNFRVPEKQDPQRYVSEHLTGSRKRGVTSGRPKVSFVREVTTEPTE